MLDESGEVTEEGRFRTTEAGVTKRFFDMEPVRIAMEAGTHSIWISEQLKEYGHEVIVANVTELHAISRNDRKSDRTDAEKLARYARLDPRILRPITHRTVEQQQAPLGRVGAPKDYGEVAVFPRIGRLALGNRRGTEGCRR
jgi:transposase